jgi:hypothetical protein
MHALLRYDRNRKLFVIFQFEGFWSTRRVELATGASIDEALRNAPDEVLIRMFRFRSASSAGEKP